MTIRKYVKQFSVHVEMLTEHGQYTGEVYICTSRGDAVKVARWAASKRAAKGTERQVYVRWYRDSDSQKGFLNDDGSYSITGRPWKVGAAI